jgi:porphobilinogen synthase
MLRSGYHERVSALATKSQLRKENLIVPLIIRENEQYGPLNTISMNEVSNILQKIHKSRIKNIMIFGIPKFRNITGSEAWNPKGIVQTLVRQIKHNFDGQFNVITDACLCQYNQSGHCGLIDRNHVNDDKSLEAILNIALSQAESGSNVIAPSCMIDGQVKLIREKLDSNGFKNVKIMSFATKMASFLYSPFRATAYDISTKPIDKSSYQLSFSNIAESMQEVKLDIDEGANMIILKPSMFYLDLIARIKEKFRIPVAVQQVSGEYYMIKAASVRKLVDEKEWTIFLMMALRRAGADLILSYNALEISKYLF